MSNTMKRSIIIALTAAATAMIMMAFSLVTANAADWSGAKELKLGEKSTETVKADDKGKLVAQYKFTIPEKEHLARITIANSTIKGDISYFVYDDAAKEGSSYFSSGYVEENTRNIEHHNVKSSHTYYVEVREGGEWNGEWSSDVTLPENEEGKFVITVETVPDKEPSDPYSAQKLKIGKLVKGSIDAQGDEDWFKFTATKDGTYRFKTSHELTMYDEDVVNWSAEYKYDDNKSTSKATYKKNKAIFRRYTMELKKGTVILFKLAGKTKDYQIVVRKGESGAYPAKGKLKSVKAGKKKLTVKYAKAKNAKKYQLSVKRDGAGWKKYELKKTSKVIGGLKSGKKYSVRVRAIADEDGDLRYGEWSKTKKVLIK